MNQSSCGRSGLGFYLLFFLTSTDLGFMYGRSGNPRTSLFIRSIAPLYFVRRFGT